MSMSTLVIILIMNHISDKCPSSSIIFHHFPYITCFLFISRVCLSLVLFVMINDSFTTSERLRILSLVMCNIEINSIDFVWWVSNLIAHKCYFDNFVVVVSVQTILMWLWIIDGSNINADQLEPLSIWCLHVHDFHDICVCRVDDHHPTTIHTCITSRYICMGFLVLLRQ